MVHEAGLHKIRRKPRKVRPVVVEEAVAVGGEVARARAARLLEDEPLADFLTSAPEYWRQVAGSTCACRLLRGRQGECVLVKSCDHASVRRVTNPLEKLIEAELAALACTEKLEEDAVSVVELGYYSGHSTAESRSSCYSPDSDMVSVRSREEELVT